MSTKWLFPALEAPLEDMNAKIVLIQLADQANDNGMSFPTIEWLAARCGNTSRRTVQRAIKALKGSGHLRVEVRRNSAGNKKNIYYLSQSLLRRPSDNMSHGASEVPEKQGAKSAPSDNMSLGQAETPENTDSEQSPGDNMASGQNEQSHVTNTTIPCDRLTHNPPNDPLNNPPKGSEIDLDWFLRAYGKATNDPEACKRKFGTLSKRDKILIQQHLPVYIQNTPDLKFRKNPENYLLSRMWTSFNPMSKPAEPVERIPFWEKQGFKSEEEYNDYAFRKKWESLGENPDKMAANG